MIVDRLDRRWKVVGMALPWCWLVAVDCDGCVVQLVDCWLVAVDCDGWFIWLIVGLWRLTVTSGSGAL